MGRRFARLGWMVVAATAWWSLIALISAANARSRGGAAGWDALAVAFVAVAGWIPLTLAVFALVQRVPIRRTGWPRAVAIHLAAAVAVVHLRAAYIYLLDPWVHFYDQAPAWRLVVMHSLENNLFVYWLFVGVGHAALYAQLALERQRTAVELEAALARAEHAALTATMQPHFLFNTLGAIAELVHRDPAAADRAIVELSALLRRLVDDRRQEVPLAEELAFTRAYLAIEQLRFGERLTVAWQLAPELADAVVPRLSIQPLVENALRHGLWPAGRAGRLTVTTRPGSDGALVIDVVDDGIGLPAEPPPTGHGLATVRARLARLYPGRGRVSLTANPGGGARCELVVPRPA
ncbi:MAG: histidine kinase [Kofleriaceae bacterium]